MKIFSLLFLLLCPYLVLSIVIQEIRVESDGSEEENPLEEGKKLC